MTNEYSLACYGAVQDAINSVTTAWDLETKNYLREQGYEVCVELYDQNLCIYGYVGKDDYFGPVKYKDQSINQAIQEVLDNLGFQVVFNAMLWLGMEDINQTIYWGIK